MPYFGSVNLIHCYLRFLVAARPFAVHGSDSRRSCPLRGIGRWLVIAGLRRFAALLILFRARVDVLAKPHRERRYAASRIA